MKATKPPVKRYECSDLALVVDGETYHPHAGEYVEFAGGPSWSFMRDAAELTRLEGQNFNALTDEDSRMLVATLDRLLEFLSSRIVGWDWTDSQGTPLPHPTRDVLGELERDEVIWLVTVLIQGGVPAQVEAEEKNV